jgi:hypothetical protein
MLGTDQKFKYSQVIIVSNSLDYEISKVENPFKNSINTSIILPSFGQLVMQLFDSRGMLVKKINIDGKKGLNQINFDQLSSLQNGFYMMQTIFNSEIRKIKLIKSN